MSGIESGSQNFSGPLTVVDSSRQERELQIVIGFVREFSLLKPQHRYLIAASGGLDSTVLVHMLAKSARLLQCEFEVVHVDHSTRGLQSQNEGVWLKVLCEQLGLPFHRLVLLDEVAHSVASGSDWESQAGWRKARRSLIENLARQRNCQAIATAHHADDNAETFLMRSMSGTGVEGLRGIHPQSGRWIHPLLSLDKADLMRYARLNHLSWTEDPSNRGDSYLRNQIRQELGRIESVRAGSVRNLARIAQRVNAEESELDAWMETQIEQGPALRRGLLERFPRALQRRMLRVWSRGLGYELSFHDLEQLLLGQDVVTRDAVFLFRSDFLVGFAESSFGEIWKNGIELDVGKRYSLGSSYFWSLIRGERSSDGQMQNHPLKKAGLELLFSFYPKRSSELKSFASLKWDQLPWPLLLRPLGNDAQRFSSYLKQSGIPQVFWSQWPVITSKERPQEVVHILGTDPITEYDAGAKHRCLELVPIWHID